MFHGKDPEVVKEQLYQEYLQGIYPYPVTLTSRDQEIVKEKLYQTALGFNDEACLDIEGFISSKEAPYTFTAMLDKGLPKVEFIDKDTIECFFYKDLGDRYIFINTAAFFLQVVENNRKAMDMKVVVGRPARQSPVFRAP